MRNGFEYFTESTVAIIVARGRGTTLLMAASTACSLTKSELAGLPVIRTEAQPATLPAK